MTDRASTMPHRLGIMCARLRIWRIVPPRPTPSTAALLTRLMHDALMLSCHTDAEAWTRVADVYVPFYETLLAIEAVEPGCVPDRHDLPTPASACVLYQQFAADSPWRHMTEDDRVAAWRSTARLDLGIGTDVMVRTALSLYNLAAFCARAARERQVLVKDDTRLPPTQTDFTDGAFLVVSRPHPQGGRTVALFTGSSEPTWLMRLADNHTCTSLYHGQAPHAFWSDCCDTQAVRRKGTLCGALLGLAARLVALGGLDLIGLRRIATDHDLPAPVAIALYDDRRGIYQHRDPSGKVRRWTDSADDDPWMPGKGLHYGMLLSWPRLDALLACTPSMLAVMRWFAATRRLDHKAARVLAQTATVTTIHAPMQRLDGETRKLFAAYAVLDSCDEADPRRLVDIAGAFGIDARAATYRADPALLGADIGVAIVNEYASRSSDFAFL
ncbi:hypothetical protein TW95_gp0561 [Pandoravirus inopinatum]|uniref:DUF5848 domain-containing protein n=1 Tax=Pandoravirus inopinatum TaxID=1605721 RepID=A0A0B5J6C3_9VIRU|nr:hypothetical protein TW95_gp0561 [Pandoravirus inopinatum]AJF97295.1 hypothetical protein [Pandoravirus inopinatum]